MRYATIGFMASVAVAAAGCVNDNTLTGGSLGDIAVTAGDFDDVQEPFNRHDVNTDQFDGIIAVATWDEDYVAREGALVEGLFPDINTMTKYKTIIVASGTRGLGGTAYNGVAPDNAFVADPVTIDNVRKFVNKGGTLVVTDWAYDLVEAAWPEQIEFLGDDSKFDGAQAGDLDTVTATVNPETSLGEAIGMDEMSVNFDFSNWAVIDSVDGADAITWMTADTSYRLPDGEGNQAHPGTPILVTLFPEGTGNGRVVVASFHFDAQTDAVLDNLVEEVVGKYKNKADVTVEPVR